MKISRFNLKILEGELDTLEGQLEPLRKAMKAWDNPSYTDAYWISIQRDRLVKELTNFRERMALIYDFMGDRGLADFIPTSIRNANEAQREPFPEEPLEEEIRIPKVNGDHPVGTPSVDEVIRMMNQREYDDG